MKYDQRITEPAGVFFGLILAAAYVLTPIHELGHLLAAHVQGIPAYWAKWNMVSVPSGPTVFIALGGAIAETLFLLPITAILMIKRRSAHYVFFYWWFWQMVKHVVFGMTSPRSDFYVASVIARTQPIALNIFVTGWIWWITKGYRRINKMMEKAPSSGLSGARHRTKTIARRSEPTRRDTGSTRRSRLTQ